MLRFQSQLEIDALPDEQIDSQFEVVMPTLYLNNDHTERKGNGSWTSWEGIKSKVSAAASNFFYGYTPIVEEINFGVRNFGANTRRVRTGWCNVPDDIKNYSDVSITFFCSSGMIIQYYLEAWKKLIFDDDGEFYYPMDTYKKDIEVYFYGPGNIGLSVGAAAHYTLKGCFPFEQDNYKLAYTMDPKRLTLTARFKMDRIVFDESMKVKALAAELITSPTSCFDKALTMVSGSSAGSDIKNLFS